MTQFTLLAKTLHGLEEVLAEEIRQLGGIEVTVLKRAVSFEGNTELMYRANINLRTALRILKPIHTFNAENEDQLYKGIDDFDWSALLHPSDTLAIDSAVSSPYFNHSQYAALKTKDAIVDQLRAKFGTRPSVDLEYPTLRINLHIHNESCTVSLDSSGQSLHKRGYRTNTVIAPINEVLAAGMLKLAGWEGKGNFVDPMCGSGTLLIEAALMAYDLPPTIGREDFGFVRWKDFDRKLYEQICSETDERIKAVRQIERKEAFAIYGNDLSENALDYVRKNIARFPFRKSIRLSSLPIEEFVPPEGGGIAVINPPYGERMNDTDVNTLYKTIGDSLKQNFTGYNVWVISSNKEAVNQIHLKPSQKHTLYNGALECKYLKYEMYAGTKLYNG